MHGLTQLLETNRTPHNLQEIRIRVRDRPRSRSSRPDLWESQQTLMSRGHVRAASSKEGAWALCQGENQPALPPLPRHQLEPKRHSGEP